MAPEMLRFSDMTRVQQGNTSQRQPYCEERRRLSDALLAAVRELMDLLTQQSNAIIHNDSDFSRFDDLIHVAQNAKNHAKYALLAHIHEHKCE
jgi:hypothetical protein